MHRIIVLTSYVLLAVSVYGFENHGVFPGQFLALLGVLVTISFLASQVMVWQSFKDCIVSGKNMGSVSFLTLSVVYLIFVISAMYKIWPQLMSV